MTFADILFPGGDHRSGDETGVLISWRESRVAHIEWLGVLGSLGPGAARSARLLESVLGGSGVSLVNQHADGVFARPGLRGHRLADRDENAGPAAGRDWSPRFVTTTVAPEHNSLSVEGVDLAGGLCLRTNFESLPGGSLRARHLLTNTGGSAFVVDGLEVVFPLDERYTEVLDFTGRHERERTVQRRDLTDGLWLREGRRGKGGFDAAMLVMAGTPRFDFDAGEVIGLHVAWSGNSVVRVERNADSGSTIGGGELLLPGEVVLAPGGSYCTPWVVVAASRDGIDSLSSAFHGWLRSRPAHPTTQPVTLNVWEAVYFDQEQARLESLATRASRVGVERFVLDDGWFAGRRDDTAGLGDWWVDETVWPDGLTPLIDHVHALGMQFGLWFEPEMVNPRSALYLAHPEWVLKARDQLPLLHRNQLALDIARQEVWDYLLERMDGLLGEYRIDYVKWDHNRDLLEAGTSREGGRPCVHDQTLAFYALLDELRSRHPDVAWESCAGGGGRIDLEVLERASRVWTSDMTDALSRQSIQRWTGALVAPEYLGCHVSSPVSHQTGRTMSLDFRAATALFGAFGIEWDLSTASPDALDCLASWVARYKRFRPLIHSGRVVRPASTDPAVLMHGVVSVDRTEALMALVQMDESAHDRGVRMRIPGLQPNRLYSLRLEGPVEQSPVGTGDEVYRSAADLRGPAKDVEVSGSLLGNYGIWIGRRRPQTVTLVHVTSREHQE